MFKSIFSEKPELNDFTKQLSQSDLSFEDVQKQVREVLGIKESKVRDLDELAREDNH